MEAERLGECQEEPETGVRFHGKGGQTNSNAATTVINQKLQIQQSAASTGESGKYLLPAGLLLV
jgi:hypothetical protein